MSGWRWSRPAMQLHPAHLSEAGVQPLKLSEAEPLLTQCMPPSEVVAQVFNQSVVIYTALGSDEVLGVLPVLGLEVSLHEDPSGEDEPFIVVAQVDGPFTLDASLQGESQVWLFRSQDGPETGQRLLELLGADGAVRKDLVISLDPTPFATGNMASVHTASCNVHGTIQTCVIKIFGERAGSETRAKVCQEVTILSQAQSSPYVVRMRGLWTSGVSEGGGRFGGLLMECCSRGDAQSATIKKPFGEFPALDIMCDVLQGLSHLHALGIIHRDIKAANILFRKSGPPVIADFGLACLVSDLQGLSKRCGSPGYVAPEIISGKGASTKSDIFSTGCTLYYMISGRIPFGRAEDDVSTVLARTLSDSLSFSDPLFAFVSARCKRFLKTLTKKSVASRPSAPEALAMQWTQGLSDGTDVEDEIATRLTVRSAPRVLSAVESLPSVHNPSQQSRSFSTAWAEIDDDEEPSMMPRSHTVSPKRLTSRPRAAARSRTSDA